MAVNNNSGSCSYSIFKGTPVLCDVSAVCLLQGLNKNKLYHVSGLPDVF